MGGIGGDTAGGRGGSHDTRQRNRGHATGTRPGRKVRLESWRPGRTSPSEEALDKVSVAELPGSAIDEMEREELIRVIRVARLPPACGSPCLSFFDLDLLRRLAYLAKKCCQTQIAATSGNNTGDVAASDSNLYH